MAEAASSHLPLAPPPQLPTSTASSTPHRRRSQDDRGPSRSSSGRALSGLTRRQSMQERIEEILETGIARAESTVSVSQQPNPQSPGLGSPQRMEPLLPKQSGRNPDDDSSNERAGIEGSSSSTCRPTAQPNYQSTATTQGKSAARSRSGDRNTDNGTSSRGNNNNGKSRSRSRHTHRHPGRETDEGDDADGPGGGTEERRTAAAAGASNGLLRRLGRTLASFGSVQLENKGSVARDHLALERTFLAWLRTSVSFASIGIAVTQLFRLNTSLNTGTGEGGSPQPPTPAQEELRRLGKPLGATFLGISILILFLGYSRYVRSQKWIMAGRFPASRGTVILVTLVTFLVMVASLAIVIAFTPGPGDR